MTTVKKQLERTAREAKRRDIPLEECVDNMKPQFREIFEAEYNRFKPRKPYRIQEGGKVDELQATEALERALVELRETEDQLKAARQAIVDARTEAEVKAIDALGRYKFQMFGYWAACWVHASRQAKAAGMEDKPSPFRFLVQEAREHKALYFGEEGGVDLLQNGAGGES